MSNGRIELDEHADKFGRCGDEQYLVRRPAFLIF
jgi:hypothetical protein